MKSAPGFKGLYWVLAHPLITAINILLKNTVKSCIIHVQSFFSKAIILFRIAFRPTDATFSQESMILYQWNKAIFRKTCVGIIGWKRILSALWLSDGHCWSCREVYQSEFGCGEWGRLSGLWHDVGKHSQPGEFAGKRRGSEQKLLQFYDSRGQACLTVCRNIL